MKTEVKVPLAEFDRYSVPKDADITVNLKELKAFVVFAEQIQTPVTLYFEEPGSPVVVALENDVNFTAELVVATVDHDCSVLESNVDQSLPVESQLEKKKKRRVLSSASSKKGNLSSVNDEPGPSSRPHTQLPPVPARADSSGISAKKQCLETPDDHKDGSMGEPVPEGGDPPLVTKNLPAPPTKKLRNFFISSTQQTMRASQLLVDGTIIISDSDGEG